MSGPESTTTRADATTSPPAKPKTKPRPGGSGKLLEIHAREKAGMPDDWECHYFNVIRVAGERLGYEVKGAIAPVKARGKGKGQRDWKRADPATERHVSFTIADHEAWVDAWVARTGMCCECVGSGKVFASWSTAEGTKYRECGDCRGTGKAEGVKGDEHGQS